MKFRTRRSHWRRWRWLPLGSVHTHSTQRTSTPCHSLAAVAHGQTWLNAAKAPVSWLFARSPSLMDMTLKAGWGSSTGLSPTFPRVTHKAGCQWWLAVSPSGVMCSSMARPTPEVALVLSCRQTAPAMSNWMLLCVREPCPSAPGLRSRACRGTTSSRSSTAATLAKCWIPCSRARTCRGRATRWPVSSSTPRRIISSPRLPRRRWREQRSAAGRTASCGPCTPSRRGGSSCSRR
mmetsp:Transcript_111345/g.314960  ORF Transcript_111345/g.314960 Transcript_111345/m.314960 type:complete len:235 (-) Transcript_111345:707-1411(-)